jgi:hypothetical protein
MNREFFFFDFFITTEMYTGCFQISWNNSMGQCQLIEDNEKDNKKILYTL